MRRLRIVIALLALGLAVPVGLLIARVLSSQALERDLQHGAVADRIFDELERALSEILEAEERRPFEQYGFYLEPLDRSLPLDAQRSPLSWPPEAAYVVGYFQLDPDGRLYSPRTPRPSAPTPPGFSLGSDHGRRWARLRDGVTRSWQETEPRQPRALADLDDAAGIASKKDRRTGPLTAPPRGSLRESEGAMARSEKRPSPGQKSGTSSGTSSAQTETSAAQIDADPPDSFDLLERLNVGARQRAVRKQKVEYGRSQYESYTQAADERPDEDLEADRAAARAPRDASLAVELAQEETREGADAAGAAPPRALSAPLVSPGTILLDPMTGRATPEGDIVLYRTVVSGERGYRQGLMIDRAALGAWLEGRVLGEGDLLRYVELEFPKAGVAPPDAPRTYRHDFAEPFEALTASLRIDPLPAPDSTISVWWLALLLAGACGVGLLALYRMVSVALHFAERRNNFVASVSHELKTPLTAIRMYSEMLRDGLVDSDAKRDEYYDTIHTESERLSRLVDNVLELSRLEKGQRESEIRVGTIEPLLREVAETLRPHAEESGFSLDVVCDPDLPPVRFDRDAIVQMLFNLVDNALKYARDAERRDVLLEGRRVADGVEVSVRDFGPGVSRVHLGRILEPFYRGEDELTRTAKGTGIGLALVRELAQSMGATLRCVNADGGGFRVTFQLPEVSPPPTSG